jgi:hypothetical protein
MFPASAGVLRPTLRDGLLVLVLVGGEGASQLAQCLLVALVRNLRKIARKFETHPFARRDRALIVVRQAVEEVADWHAQHLCDLEQSSGRHAVDRALVFVRLLIGDADQIGELLLSEAEHDPPLADARTDVAIDVLRPARRSPRSGRVAGRRHDVGFGSGRFGTKRCDPVLVSHLAPLAQLMIPAQPEARFHRRVGISVGTAALYSQIAINSMVPADKTVAMCHFLGKSTAQTARNAAHICAFCMPFALTANGRQ